MHNQNFSTLLNDSKILYSLDKLSINSLFTCELFTPIQSYRALLSTFYISFISRFSNLSLSPAPLPSNNFFCFFPVLSLFVLKSIFAVLCQFTVIFEAGQIHGSPSTWTGSEYNICISTFFPYDELDLF